MDFFFYFIESKLPRRLRKISILLLLYVRNDEKKKMIEEMNWKIWRYGETITKILFSCLICHIYFIINNLAVSLCFILTAISVYMMIKLTQSSIFTWISYSQILICHCFPLLWLILIEQSWRRTYNSMVVHEATNDGIPAAQSVLNNEDIFFKV